jgi:transcriptional regulator with XRE-family HTH domain
MANNISNQSLGDLIREARVAKGFGLREMARKIGKTPSYLSDIENDRRVPAEDVLQDIAHLLDVDFDELMARAGRFGEEAVRYMMKTPAAGMLFRKISEHKLPEEQLQELAARVEQLAKKKRKRDE